MLSIFSSKKYKNLYNQGLDQIAKGDFPEAEKLFLQAIALNPERYEAYYNLGLAYLKVNKNKEAERNFKISIEKNPGDADSHYNLGLLYHNLNKLKKALVCYKKYISLAGSDPDCNINMGLILIEQGDFPAAKDHIFNAIDADPDNIDYKLALAYLFNIKSSKTGISEDIKYAIQAYQDVLLLDKNNEESLYQISVCYAKDGNWEKSVLYSNRLISVNKNSAVAYNQLGLALYCNDELKKAVEMYEKAIVIDSGYKEAYLNLGYALEQDNDIKSAINSFEICANLADNPEEKAGIRKHILQLKEKNN